MLGGGYKKKKVLKLTDKYVSEKLPQDHYEWRIYWRDMGEVLKSAR